MARISTLINLLTYGIALIGYAPLAPHLETIPRLIFPVSLVCGIIADRKRRWLTGSLPTIVSILFFIFYSTQLSKANLVGPAVNLLIVLLSIRLVSEKKVRNYLQIFVLSLFSLAGSSLFSLDPLFLAYLISLLFLVAMALVILTFHAADNDLELPGRGMKTVLSVALIIPVAALPLICLFFTILPRTQFPLWNFLNSAGSKVTAFSEKVQPGSAASIGEVKEPAFRVECEKLDKERLYWRGIVLNNFTGNAWVKGDLPADERGRVAKGTVVRQTFYSGSGTGYLFTLNAPLLITGVRGNLSGDLVFKSPPPSAGRMKYEVESIPGSIIGTTRGIDRNYYLRLPSSLSSRMTSVGREIAKKGKNDAERVDLLKEFYLSSGISYATRGLPVSSEPLDEFLFVKKRGNCEFFAASFAILLRAAGVPSRVVGGYFGGEYNELGGYYLVTEDMAHAWVEAYLSGTGWVTIDPSAFSADFRQIVGNSPTGLAYRLGLFLDSFNFYWDRAVISYDLERQFSLVNKITLRVRQLPINIDYKALLFSVAVTLVPAVLIIAVLRSNRVAREERILRRFLRILKRKYPLEIDPSTGILELADNSRDPVAKRFADVYCRAVYSDRRLDDDEFLLLEDLLLSLKSSRR
ncbi:MAG TPA: DUF3488 and transglutaminase-like domain-containing protein [Geobacteraceae bacterium]|nr:DUF3488 and transglutaminase-like domain-containing protein [Geobacteraceae bacterium]